MVTGEPLFRGRTSEIHRWHDDRTVVKLYPAGEPIERAEHELHNTRTAADQGVRGPSAPRDPVSEVAALNGSGTRPPFIARALDDDGISLPSFQSDGR